MGDGFGGDDVGGSVLGTILLVFALWAITRPRADLGRGWRSLAWLRPVSWIVLGLLLIWGIKKLAETYFH